MSEDGWRERMVSNVGKGFWIFPHSEPKQGQGNDVAQSFSLTEWERTTFAMRSFKKSLGSCAHLHCAMLSCNLSRLKTHLTKCKEGNALIPSGKGQKWHEWLGALLCILIRRCVVLRFFKDFEAGSVKHEAPDSWEFYLPEGIRLFFSCHFWIYFFFSLQSDTNYFVIEAYFTLGAIGKHSWHWQKRPGWDDLRVED